MSTTITTVLPGVDALGHGFKVTGMYDTESVTTELVRIDKSKGTPVTEFGTEYLLPTNCSHVDIFDDVAEFQSYSSRDEFTSDLAAKASVEGSAWGFSAEFDASYSTRKEETQSAYFGRVFSYYRFWRVLLDIHSVDLDPDFAADLAALPAQFTPATQNAFFDLFNKYGTHVITSTVVGGELDYSVSVTAASSFTKDSTNVNMSYEWNGVFASSSGEGHASWDKMDKSWLSSRSAHLHVIGGEPTVAGKLEHAVLPSGGSEYVNHNDLVEPWSKTLETSPGLLDFALQPISHLAPTSQVRLLEQALDAYLNFGVEAATRASVSYGRTEFAVLENSSRITVAHSDVTPPTPQPQKAAPGYWIVLADDLGAVQYNGNRFSTDPDDFDALVAEARKAAGNNRWWVAVVVSALVKPPSVTAAGWLESCGIRADVWDQGGGYPTWPKLFSAVGRTNSSTYKGVADYVLWWQSPGEPPSTTFEKTSAAKPLFISAFGSEE